MKVELDVKSVGRAVILGLAETGLGPSEFFVGDYLLLTRLFTARSVGATKRSCLLFLR